MLISIMKSGSIKNVCRIYIVDAECNIYYLNNITPKIAYFKGKGVSDKHTTKQTNKQTVTLLI